jgi:hypothetical protein
MRLQTGVHLASLVSAETSAEQRASECNRQEIPSRRKNMRRMMLLCVAVLCFTGLLYSQDASSKSQSHEMSGTICNSACVTKADNLSTCDTNCTDKSGECVFVDDSGNVKKIENQAMAMPHQGKHVKVKAVKVPTEKEREEEVRLLDLSLGR